jgi:hypothetical protein
MCLGLRHPNNEIGNLAHDPGQVRVQVGTPLSSTHRTLSTTLSFSPLGLPMMRPSDCTRGRRARFTDRHFHFGE